MKHSFAINIGFTFLLLGTAAALSSDFNDNGLTLDLSSNATFLKNSKNQTEVGNSNNTSFLLSVTLKTPPHHFFIGLYYSVEFHYHNGTNRSDHLLATHRVSAIPNSGKQHHLFTPNQLVPGITVHSGEHFSFPTFEVLVHTEAKNTTVHFSHFWVVLVDEYAHGRRYQSNQLPSPPALNYTLSKVNSSSHEEVIHDAKCSVSHFDPERRSFSVKFYYAKNNQANQAHLLATYQLHRGVDGLEEFLPNNNEIDQVVVTSGKEVFYPNFEITIKKLNVSEASSSYCTLTVDGSAQPVVKSNEVKF